MRPSISPFQREERGGLSASRNHTQVGNSQIDIIGGAAEPPVTAPRPPTSDSSEGETAAATAWLRDLHGPPRGEPGKRGAVDTEGDNTAATTEGVPPLTHLPRHTPARPWYENQLEVARAKRQGRETGEGSVRRCNGFCWSRSDTSIQAQGRPEGEEQNPRQKLPHEYKSATPTGGFGT